GYGENQGYGQNQGYGGENQGYDGGNYGGENQGYDGQNYGESRGFDNDYSESRGFDKEEHSRDVKQFFMDDDGSLNKSRIAALSALLAGGGFAVKKVYDHYQEGEEEEEKPYVEENDSNSVKQFFMDSDGSLNKSRIAAATAVLAGSGFAIKKAYDHYNQEDTEGEPQHHEEDEAPGRFKQFFTDEDGSVDKSHVAMATALFGGLALAGKKFYDKRQERQNDQYQHDQYQQGGNYPQGDYAQGQYPPKGNHPQGDYPQGGNYPQGQYGEAKEEKHNSVKQFFMDDDGTLNKSRIAALSALLAGGGFAVKKVYDHYQEDEEEEEKPQVEEEDSNSVKQFFMDEDGTLDKSKIAMATAVLAGGGFAIKKAYDHYNEDEGEKSSSDEESGDSPNRIKQFFTDEDGSVDKSHVAMATALFGGLALAGKKVYDRRRGE
ncbi:hypothetical protein IWW55_006308, partial [Coemansia sp. RSA 2706]